MNRRPTARRGRRVSGAICVGVAGILSACGSTSSTPTPSVSATAAGPSGTITIANFTGDSEATTQPFHIDVGTWLIQYQLTAADCTGAGLAVYAYNNANPSAFVRNFQVTGCGNDAIKVLDGPGDFFLKISPTAAVYNIQVIEVRQAG